MTLVFLSHLHQENY